jgi:hypothetical protein
MLTKAWRRAAATAVAATLTAGVVQMLSPGFAVAGLADEHVTTLVATAPSTAFAGDLVTVLVKATDSANLEISGAVPRFAVISGANPTVGPALSCTTTDAHGDSSCTYPTATSGTDQVQVWIDYASGTAGALDPAEPWVTAQVDVLPQATPDPSPPPTPNPSAGPTGPPGPAPTPTPSAGPTGPPGPAPSTQPTGQPSPPTSPSPSSLPSPPPPPSVTQQVTGGGVVSTGGDATPEAPLQTSILAPQAFADGSAVGTISITTQARTGGTSGFALLGQQVVIEGPAATARAPYEMTFTVDAAELGGLPPDQVVVIRNDVPLASCEHAVEAVPDPCVVTAHAGAGVPADAVVVVRTSHFSTWQLGVYNRSLDLHLSAPLPPVAAYPAVNRVNSGSAVPVKFRVGGDRGLAILGGPALLTPYDCTNGTRGAATTIPVSLSYDRTSQVYSFVWKTAKTTTGCQELRLMFRDGSRLRARFAFAK